MTSLLLTTLHLYVTFIRYVYSTEREREREFCLERERE